MTKNVQFLAILFCLGLAGFWFFDAPPVVHGGSISPPAYGTIQNAGVSVTQRPILNFPNGGCVDNAGSNRTDCTVGGGSGTPSLFSQTNSVTDAVQTTETTLVGTGTGSTALTANFYAVGTVLQFRASGFYSTTASPGTLTIKLKHAGGATGTVIVANTGAITPLASITNGAWRMWAEVTCRTTGTGGTLIVNSVFESLPSSLSALTPANASMVNTAVVTVDTTASQTVDFTAAWSAAGQSITSTNIRFGGISAGSGPGTFLVANAGVTGTTINTLTKLTAAPSTAVIAGTADTSGFIGITSGGAGTTGNATITFEGSTSCVFDGATTAGDYFIPSTTTAGNCHDIGSSAQTVRTLGRVLSTNAGGGTFSVILFAQDLTSDTVWTGFAYQNSWADFGGGFQTGQFRKDRSGRVWLRGLLACGTTTGGTVMLALPAGFRPTGNGTELLGALGSGGFDDRIDVATGGNVVYNGSACSFLSLSGLSFSAE